MEQSSPLEPAALRAPGAPQPAAPWRPSEPRQEPPPEPELDYAGGHSKVSTAGGASLAWPGPGQYPGALEALETGFFPPLAYKSTTWYSFSTSDRFPAKGSTETRPEPGHYDVRRDLRNQGGTIDRTKAIVDWRHASKRHFAAVKPRDAHGAHAMPLGPPSPRLARTQSLPPLPGPRAHERRVEVVPDFVPKLGGSTLDLKRLTGGRGANGSMNLFGSTIKQRGLHRRASSLEKVCRERKAAQRPEDDDGFQGWVETLRRIHAQGVSWKVET